MKRVMAIVAILALTACSPRDVPSSQPMPAVKAWVAVKGQSMLPTFPVKALVEFETVPYASLKEGDTVLFWDYTGTSGATFIHHRLVGQQAGAFIARGDNMATNTREDAPWVTKDNYIGRTTGRHTQILTP